MDKERREQEREWERIVNDSRKNNTNIINMFTTETTHVETFTEKFRVQAAQSVEGLQQMRREMQGAVDEMAAAKEEIPTTAQEGSAWQYMVERKSNFEYILRDFEDLLTNTEKLIDGIVALTHVVDQMAAEGLHPNQLILYEEEFKDLTRKVNDIFHQINLAAFHLHGTLAKEKEIAVNMRLGTEKEEDVLRHHQAVLWAYNQYLEYRATGNQYIISTMQALDIFMQAIRKEVMRRKVEQLHVSARDISLARMEAMAKQEKERAARRELGEDYEEEEETELPSMPSVTRSTVVSEEALRRAQAEREAREAKAQEEEERRVLEAQEKASDEVEEFGEEEEKRPLFPLLILICILLGVAYYYFFMKQ